MENKNLFLTLQSVVLKITSEDVKNFLQLLDSNEMRILKQPQVGLLMMAATDSFETDFYVGEILVTEAEVEYKGIVGYGMVIGQEPERALLISILDAILRSNDVESINRIEKFLMQKQNEIAVSHEIEKRLIAKTKVSFEMMAKG